MNEPKVTVEEAMEFLTGQASPQPGATDADGQSPHRSTKPKKQKKNHTDHRFAKRLAVFLNPDRPDITGALLMYCLHLWRESAKKRSFPLPRGISCYRSLSQLEEDLPYLGHSTIHSALDRLEKRLGADQFRVIRDKKHLSFVLGDQIEGLCAEPLIGFKIDDAKKYGVSQAIMLEHLNFANRPNSTHQSAWHEDRPYYHVSPTVLSRKDATNNGEQILPMSRSTIQTALNDLVAKDIVLKHPELSSYYARRNYPKIEPKSQSSKRNDND